MSARPQPLKPLNNGQLNRATLTPVKPLRKLEELQYRPRYDSPQAEERPKKKKEKLSALCKTPPLVVRTRNGIDYRRGSFLGEGGFARCFQMKDAQGKLYAAKTVAKALIKNEKTKTKLLLEIKIHKLLKHANIVNFVDCFEDDVNVYILLEICPNQLLMELLKTRKRISEPEARFFMVQIIGAVKYLHLRRVIHRDLKLGNIFFDPDMNLKIGDFGLALALPTATARKYTICGTPNYIAPEVLGGKNTGHSFEVDIWAIGIMLYALLVGKPPFQAKDVNVIYERIKKNDYLFPPDKPILAEARALIRDLLALSPLARPLVGEILDYAWFRGLFPPRISEGALTATPQGVHDVLAKQLAVNFTNIKNLAGIYTPKLSRPVEILQLDLHLDQPKTVLPQLLSPGDTRHKYQEVSVPKELIQTPLLRRLQFSARFNRTILKLEQVLRETGANMRRAQEMHAAGVLDTLGLPACEHPTLISKWVDYTNRYGFSYQMNNDDIGVLFNDGNTVLRVHNSERFLELVHNDNEGWTCIENLVAHPPLHLRTQLEIVDFFARYMNSNLSKVSENERGGELVFLRRYTRNADYIMFEMTNGTFQFNFKDHHKFCVLRSGLAITHVSPSRVIQTHPLVVVLSHGNFLHSAVPDCLGKIAVMTAAIRDKAARHNA